MSDFALEGRARLLQKLDQEIEKFQRFLYEASVEEQVDTQTQAAIVEAAVTDQERNLLRKARTKSVEGLTPDQVVALYTTALNVVQRLRTAAES